MHSHNSHAATTKLGSQRALAQSSSDLVLQVMHINQRIKIRLPEGEPLSQFYQKLCVYFEIAGDKNSSQVGLFERRTVNDYHFVKERADIKHDHLYYLYFRTQPDKAILAETANTTPLGRHLSPEDLGEEEEVKGRGGTLTTRGVGSYHQGGTAQFKNGKNQGINMQIAQIEKVKRPKEEKKVLICPFEDCLKEFSETGNLKTHMRTHTGERPFVCDQCGQQFITKGHLQAHELTHTGEKPFVCPHPGCTKRYSRAGRLKIHQRLHTGERPFICQVEGCEKAFREKGNLLTHQRIHNGQKPFRCDYADCDMSFTTQGHLTDHKRRHSGERPYNCEMCSDKFMRSSTLKIHMRRHTGEKPYRCDKCDRCFSESGNLRTHQKVHEDDDSSIGKRSRKTPGSRFSSAVVTPVSCIHKKRTLKVTKKTLSALDRPRLMGDSALVLQSEDRALEIEEDEDKSPPPLNLKAVPEIQTEYIHSQKQQANKSQIKLLPAEPMSTVAEEGTRRRKLTDGSLQSQNAQGKNGGGITVSTGKHGNSLQGGHYVEAQANNENQDDDNVKLPIIKLEQTGPPGLPNIAEVNFSNYNQGGTTSQRYDQFSGITPPFNQSILNQYGGFTGTNISAGAFDTPFGLMSQGQQPTFGQQQSFQQQQQQSITLPGFAQTQLMNTGGVNPNFPFSPTSVFNFPFTGTNGGATIGNSAFSPKAGTSGLYIGNASANGNTSAAAQLFLNTPTGAAPGDSIMQSKRIGGITMGGGQQANNPSSFFGNVPESTTHMKNKIQGSFGTLKSLGTQGNQLQQQNYHSTLVGQQTLNSPEVHTSSNQSALIAQHILGAFPKTNGEIASNNHSALSLAQGLTSLGGRFSSIPGNTGAANDSSPGGGHHNIGGGGQRKINIPTFGIAARGIQQQTMALNVHQTQMNPGFSQINNQTGPTPTSGHHGQSSDRQQSSQSRSNVFPEAGTNADDPQSFSNLVAKFQGNGAHQNNSPDNSPVKLGLAAAHSFTSLANISKQQNMIGISENSAFRKSPRVANSSNTKLPGISGFSANNTPRVYNASANNDQKAFPQKRQVQQASVMGQQILYQGAGQQMLYATQPQQQQSQQQQQQQQNSQMHFLQVQPQQKLTFSQQLAHQQQITNCSSAGFVNYNNKQQLGSPSPHNGASVCGHPAASSNNMNPNHNSNSLFDDLSSPKLLTLNTASSSVMQFPSQNNAQQQQQQTFQQQMQIRQALAYQQQLQPYQQQQQQYLSQQQHH